MTTPSRLMFISTTFLMLAALAQNLHASETVPAVYQDEYLTVRAGIPEIGLQPVHVGDAISLLIQLEFDGTELQVENLDSDFFQRAFADQKAIELYAEPVVTRADDGDGRVRIRASWKFQILDCPGELAQCSGTKVYELPIITVAYQLMDETGNAVNDKSVRFRPWPGNVTVTPSIAALSGSADEFADYFPGGAYQEALPIADRQYAALIAAFAGTFFLGVGIRNSMRRIRPSGHAAPTRGTATRWENTLSCLRTSKLHDDQWADMLRRSATWYCVDELACNPYVWLENGAMTTASVAQPLAAFRAFFADILNQERIEPQRRDEYLLQFTRLVEAPAGSETPEKPA